MLYRLLSLSLLAGALVAFGGCAASRTAASSSFERVRVVTDRHDTLAPDGVRHLLELPGNRLAVAVGGRLLVIEGDRLLGSVDSLPDIRSLAVVGDTVYAGSDRGLYAISLNGFKGSRLEIPALGTMPPITALAVGPSGELWIGTKGYGVFERVRGAILPERGAPNIMSLAVTADSSVWIATYVGLHRIHRGEYEAYSEEIHHEGLAIPDNIVEHVQTDGDGNLWVFMSRAVSVITPEQSAAEEGHIDPVTWSYLGSDENTITAFGDGPNRSQWFIGNDGLLMLTGVDIDHEAEHHAHGLSDIIERPEGTLVEIGRTLSQIDPSFDDSVARDICFGQDGTVWIGTDKGLWRIGSGLAERLSTTEHRAPVASAR